MSENESHDRDLDALVTENADLRARLRESRDQGYKILDNNDELRRKMRKRRDLMGPKYRNPAVCSDGRVFAYPFETSREETIRWFAGQALGHVLRDTEKGEDTIAIGAAVLIALDLWDELEMTFKAEREKRAAAAIKAVASETSQIENRDETDGND